MANDQFDYDTALPLEIRHSVEAALDVQVLVTMHGLVSGHFNSSAPMTLQMPSGMPSSLRLTYVVTGNAGSQYRIKTLLHQAEREHIITTNGRVERSATTSHELILRGEALDELGGRKRPGWIEGAERPRYFPEMEIPKDMLDPWLPGDSYKPLDDSDAPPVLAPAPAARPRPGSGDSPGRQSAEDPWGPHGPRGSSVGSSGPRSGPPSASLLAAKKGERYVVWFATNRKPETHGGVLKGFSSKRDTKVNYGSCIVTIPASHKIGSVGSPWWKRWILRKDDRLRIVKTSTSNQDAHWTQIAAVLRKTRLDERDAVVFLHGYNVSFEQAALRAAQLGFDLSIKGVMSFYSWPSQGTLAGYTADEAAIEASEGFITDYLSAMATRSGANKVHIIAHSMGNRGLLPAVDRIATTAAQRSAIQFNQIILAAADVDQDTFKRLSTAYKRVAARTTLYVCARDHAVEASNWLHDYPRVGLTPPVLVVPDIDTINVSNLDLTLLGHGYVAEARELLTDIHHLFRHGSPPTSGSACTGRHASVCECLTHLRQVGVLEDSLRSRALARRNEN